MDPTQNILPRGIVVNSPHIEGSIESLDENPVDDEAIAQLWKVYTTTQRRLRDPTAERLENLWWRIWGSEGKKLKGAIVASLFGQISDGETFVPLRGPPNRDEGPSLNPRTHGGPGASSTTALNRAKNKPGNESSSSSRNNAPMPHPILKKTRGPSNTGPKPTARFVSPPDTEDEHAPESSVTSTNEHVVVEPPSPQEPQEPHDPHDTEAGKRPAAVLSTKKKAAFVAPTKKKRPVVSRRQSSQTSQSSTDSPSRFTEGSQFPGIKSSSERTPPNFQAQPRQRPQSRFQENFSPSSGQSLSNAQPPKKRNASRASDLRRPGMPPRRSTGRKEKTVVAEGAGRYAPSTVDPGEGPSTVLGRVENQQDKLADPGVRPSTATQAVEEQGNILVAPATLTVEELELQRAILEEANARVGRQNQMAQQLIQQSNAASARPGRSVSDNLGAVGLLSHNSTSKSSASLAPTLAEASGQINMENKASEAIQETSSSERLDKGKGRDPEELRCIEQFAKRPVIAPASVPNDTSGLSRSKSQLTLLLQKDRARSGEQKTPKKDQGGKKR